MISHNTGIFHPAHSHFGGEQTWLPQQHLIELPTYLGSYCSGANHQFTPTTIEVPLGTISPKYLPQSLWDAQVLAAVRWPDPSARSPPTTEPVAVAPHSYTIESPSEVGSTPTDPMSTTGSTPADCPSSVATGRTGPSCTHHNPSVGHRNWSQLHPL